MERKKLCISLSEILFQYWIGTKMTSIHFKCSKSFFCAIFVSISTLVWNQFDFFYICFLTEKNSSYTTIMATAMKIKNAIWNVMGDTYQGRTTQIASYDIFTSLSVFIEKINMWQTPSIPLDFELMCKSCCWRILRAFFSLHLLISI